GLSMAELEVWFQQRAGRAVPPATLLLFSGSQEPPASLRPQVVLQVASAALADGLMQWPATRELIESRLGPTALTVRAAALAALREQLTRLGMSIDQREG